MSDRCDHCGEAIEYVEGFGWKVAGSAQGFICYHEGAGRMMAEAHEPQATR